MTTDEAFTGTGLSTPSYATDNVYSSEATVSDQEIGTLDHRPDVGHSYASTSSTHFAGTAVMGLASTGYAMTDVGGRASGGLSTEVASNNTAAGQTTSEGTPKLSTMSNFDLECVVDSNSIINDELATTNNSLTFNWTLSESSSSLNCKNITICITSGADVCKYPSTNVSSGRVTFVDLTPGTTYMVNISVTDSTYGMTSDTASGTTKLIPPVSPGVVSVTEINITVNWTNPAANYNTVIINCTGLGDAKSDIVNVSNNKNIGTCSGLTPGAIYNIILSTALNSGATPPAETETLHSVTDTAAPIIDVDAIAVDETSITVSWSKPEGVVDKYILTCDDIETIVTTTNGSCTNLTSGDTYNVIVCSSLNGSEPMENCSTPESVTTVPYGPAFVLVEDRNTSAIEVNVEGPEEYTLFDLYLVCVDGEDSVSENCPRNADLTVPSNESFFTISDLTAGVTYYIQVYTSSNNVISTDMVDTTNTTCKSSWNNVELL
ncbi:hypothetical protein LSH36_517g03010 [Paralvinella palmiformis]|uniref:Fibronectin type-III domain-containing protein n=1 Tax=Paralvinella palmiformis TaxID=53620 RepID=A0AAD9MW99_9ANNE|nr:hypothetical protein LSH36_517g03010 [Paralvinella palmiformis]